MSPPSKPVIFGLYVVFALGYAVVQPLKQLPDEGANLQYVDFLATQHRLPEWAPTGGEGGYESQHPPLAFLCYIPTRWLLGRASEAWRVQGLRCCAIGFGLVLLLLASRLFERVFGPEDDRRLYALATVAWMPHLILYCVHPNPDLFVAIFATAGLWLSWETVQAEPDVRRAAILGAVLAGGLWSKLSAVAIAAPILLAYLIRLRRGTPAKLVIRDALVTFAVASVLYAPWVIRNLLRYGRPVLKVVAPYGSALDNLPRLGAAMLLKLTVLRTYLSIWSQPDWIAGYPNPTDPNPLDFPVLWVWVVYGLITVCFLAAIAGCAKARATGPVRDLLLLGLVLWVALELGHQLAFWTQDVEFNMGGRYLISGLAGLAAWMAVGLRHWDRRLVAAWVIGLALLNLQCLATLQVLLVPHYHPDWQWFTIP